MEIPPNLNPNPVFVSSEVGSTHIDEPFAWLAMRAIDSLTIDGYRLVSVDRADRQADNTMHVTCSTDEGSSHLFIFNPFEDGTVLHLLIDQRTA